MNTRKMAIAIVLLLAALTGAIIIIAVVTGLHYGTPVARPIKTK